MLAGAMLGLSLPSYDLWPLAWIGLAPMLLAIRGRAGRRAFAVAWAGWFMFSLVVLYWIAPTISNYTRIAAPLAIGVLVLLCAVSSVFVGAFAAVLEWLATAGISRVVAAPMLWVSAEWLRTFFPAEFPWAFLGYSQYAVLPVVQIADVGAVYAVSALLVFVNAALAEIVRDGWRRHAGLAIATAAAIVLDLGYGFVRLAQVGSARPLAELPIGIAQGNVPQDEKWSADNQDATLERYLRLSRTTVDAGARVVVWPEAAVPFFLRYDRRALDIQQFADDTGALLLIGAPGYERRDEGPPRQFNQAWLVVPDVGLEGPYDKIVLVPFGEYVPFGGLFGWVSTAVEAVGQFGRGEHELVFHGPQIETQKGPRPVGLAPLICYEGIFPDLVRRFVRNGADVLVNISNDAWYGRTSAPHQHLAMAAMRAVENRVPMVRSTNTGISAVVDPTGRIRSRTGLFEEAAFVASVGIVEGGSLYTRIGDVFVYACVTGSLLLVYIRRRLGAVSIDDEALRSNHP
jgi:apolipoprotein N-acyltransferase